LRIQFFENPQYIVVYKCRNCLGEDFAKDLSEHDDPANPEFAFLLDTNVYYCEMVKHFQKLSFNNMTNRYSNRKLKTEATVQTEQGQEPTPMAVCGLLVVILLNANICSLFN